MTSWYEHKERCLCFDLVERASLPSQPARYLESVLEQFGHCGSLEKHLWEGSKQRDGHGSENFLVLRTDSGRISFCQSTRPRTMAGVLQVVLISAMLDWRQVPSRLAVCWLVQ